jgi:hypothetical protein
MNTTKTRSAYFSQRQAEIDHFPRQSYRDPLLDVRAATFMAAQLAKTLALFTRGHEGVNWQHARNHHSNSHLHAR